MPPKEKPAFTGKGGESGSKKRDVTPKKKEDATAKKAAKNSATPKNDAKHKSGAKPSAKGTEEKKKEEKKKRTTSETKKKDAEEGKKGSEAEKKKPKKSTITAAVIDSEDEDQGSPSDGEEIQTINSRSERNNERQNKLYEKIMDRLDNYNDESINIQKIRTDISGRESQIGAQSSRHQKGISNDLNQMGTPRVESGPSAGGVFGGPQSRRSNMNYNQIPECETAMEDTQSMAGLSHQQQNAMGGIIPCHMLNEENEDTKLLDQIQDLQNKNIELKKKCHKYKKQVSIIPELRDELQNLREQLMQVEQGYVASKQKNAGFSGSNGAEEEDVSFGKNAEGQVGMAGPASRTGLSLPQLRKILDRLEEKNYSLVKENIDLKGQISELKEQVIKRNNFIEGLRSELRININDLKYLHQKLNHGQELVIREPELTGKFLVSQIDHLIEEKLAIIKDAYDKNLLQEERINGFREQILHLQSMIDRNQQVVVNQTARLTTLEDMNRNLKNDVTVKSESERYLELFKSNIKNRLLEIRAQIEYIQMEPIHPSASQAPQRIYHDLSIEQLLDQIADRSKYACNNERTLRSHVEQLQADLQKRSLEIRDLEARLVSRGVSFAGSAAPLSNEERSKMQEQIRKLEEIIAAESSSGRNRQTIDPSNVEILEAFIYQLLYKIKTLIYQKNYLQVESRSFQESLNRVESELKQLVPDRYPSNNKGEHPIKKFKKVARAVMFSVRLRRCNVLQYGEIMQRKRTADRLSDNWCNFRQLWEPQIRQNIRIHSAADILLQKFAPWPLILRDLPRRFYNDERLQLIDSLRVRLGDLQHQALTSSQRANELKYMSDFAQHQQRALYYSQDPYYQQVTMSSPHNGRSDQAVQDEIIGRQRARIRELESRLEEQRVTYEQKLRYLKQELDMKKHQIENMRSLIQVSEAPSLAESRTEDDKAPKIKPIRTGGGFLLPSQDPEAYAVAAQKLQEEQKDKN